MKEGIVLFGAGNFGKVHANDLNILGVLKGIVDTNPEKKEIANKYGVPFANSDITKGDSVPNFVEEAKGIDIATNTDSHFSLLIYGMKTGKRIFVEKPPVETMDQFKYVLSQKELSSSLVGVDYIEMAHPVVGATKENIEETPVYYLNHRAKDLRGVTRRGIGGGEGSRIVLEDLVHDLSEINFFRGGLENAKITNARIVQWKDIGYPYNTDVRASFEIEFPEAKAEVKGGFADPEVRQYVIVYDEFKEAVYGNTLSRPHISPIAARVRGKENVNYIIEKVRSGSILTEENQKKVLKKTNAETLEEDMKKYVPECKWKDGEPKYGWAPLYNMLENFIRAEDDNQLICPLRKAYDIQRIAEEVYRVAGKPEAMKV